MWRPDGPAPRIKYSPTLTGGQDQKLGFYFSKKFSAYRKAIGVQRTGLDYHSFRHGVTTKLYDATSTRAGSTC